MAVTHAFSLRRIWLDWLGDAGRVTLVVVTACLILCIVAWA